MLGEPFVHESVVGVEEIQYGAILVHDAFKEQFGFLLEGLAQVVVEIGKFTAIGIGAFQIPKVEPLAGEIGAERVGAIVGQHAASLAFQDRGLVQLALNRQVQQLVVGDAGP